MTPSTDSTVNNHLKSLELPGLGRKLGELARIVVDNPAKDRVAVRIELGFPAASRHDEIRQLVAEAVGKDSGLSQVDIDIATKIVAHGVQSGLQPIPGVRNIVAVASGKGGVGKSTVAANLALGLAHDGARVGMLDADIYGPSQPQMLGIVDGQPQSVDGKTMDPLEAHGLQVMSIGFLVDPDQPMIWRGPMVTTALQQLLNQTNWQDLDYMIVDMPPGTGDIALTLSQKVPVSGAVIVTTPQDIATLDARKGLAMFRKVNVPVLGVIENMSTHVCSNCGHEEAIFGSGGAQKMSTDFDIELLAQLPLEATIREHMDRGTPTVIAAPDSAAAAAYIGAAQRMSAALATRAKDYSSKFGKIVVESQ